MDVSLVTRHSPTRHSPALSRFTCRAHDDLALTALESAYINIAFGQFSAYSTANLERAATCPLFCDANLRTNATKYLTIKLRHAAACCRRNAVVPCDKQSKRYRLLLITCHHLFVYTCECINIRG